jgi:hypothetical protein
MKSNSVSRNRCVNQGKSSFEITYGGSRGASTAMELEGVSFYVDPACFHIQFQVMLKKSDEMPGFESFLVN